MKRSLLFPFGLILALTSSAQSLFKLIDIPGENTPYAGSSVRAADDGFIVELRLDSDEVVWRCDADGNPLWCKRFSPETGLMTAMPDGGFVFSRSSSFDQFEGTYDHDLVRVDVNGDIMWSKEITGSGVPYIYMLITTERPLIVSDGIVITHWAEPQLIVEKIGFDGTPLWAEAIDIGPVSIGLDIETTSSADGRLHLICSAYSGAWWNVTTINGDGDMLWNKRYSLTNGFWEFGSTAHISGFLGQDVIIGGGLNNMSLMENYDFLARLDPLGQVRWMNFYESASVGYGILTDDNGTIFLGGARTVLDSNGVQLSRLNGSLPSVTENDTLYNYPIGSGDLDLASQQRWQSGRYRKEDQIFGVIRSRPVIIRTEWDWSGSCFTVQDQPIYDPLLVPADVQLVVDGDTAVVLTLSSEDISWSTENATLYQTVDHCSSNLAVSDVSPAPLASLLVSNVVASGDDLQIRTSAPIYVDVFDMTGKRIARTSLNGAGSLLTRDWSSGAYIVHATSLDGSNIRTARVVVF